MVSTVAATPAQFDVDPGLLSAIGDPASPRPYHTRVEPPSSLPGRVGTLESLRTLLGGMRQGADFYVAERARKGELYRGLGGELPAVFVWNPETMQEILRNEGGAWSTAMGWDALMLSRLHPRPANSGWLLAMDFDPHKHARKLLQPAFTPKAVKGYFEIARPAIDAAVEGWKTQGRVAFKPAVRAMLADLANEIFTGFASPQERASLDRALTDTWRGVLSPTRRTFLNPLLQRAQRGYDFVHARLHAELPLRRNQPARDLLSQLSLSGSPDGSDDRGLASLMMTVMFGAYDTTSLAVASMAYLLAKYPAWQDNLRDEARAVDVQNVASLELMELVWKETLRLMPVAGFSPRRALRDVTLGGHRLRAGTFVGLMNGPIGALPKRVQRPPDVQPGALPRAASARRLRAVRRRSPRVHRHAAGQHGSEDAVSRAADAHALHARARRRPSPHVQPTRHRAGQG